jgi:hypothetical protein
MKGGPRVWGGLLMSKPMWSNAQGRSTTSAFFSLNFTGDAIVVIHL